jgi:hypothetical protein
MGLGVEAVLPAQLGLRGKALTGTELGQQAVEAAGCLEWRQGPGRSWAMFPQPWGSVRGLGGRHREQTPQPESLSQGRHGHLPGQRARSADPSSGPLCDARASAGT